jgi:hypothetical protein
VTIPTQGEEFAKLLEYLTKAQESAAMLGHLTRDNDKHLAHGWMGISELMKKMKHQITTMATRKMQ